MVLSTKQMHAYTFPKYNAKALICDGAPRSGNLIIRDAFIDWAMENYWNCDFAMCAPDYDSAMNNLIRYIRDNKELNQKYKIRFTSGTFEIDGNAVNRFHIFVNGKNAKDKMHGLNLAGALFINSAMLSEELVNMACGRCDWIPNSRLWFHSIPFVESNWFHREWIQKQYEKKVLYLHFTLDDNPEITEDVKQRYLKMYSGAKYKHYIDGKWLNEKDIKELL